MKKLLLLVLSAFCLGACSVDPIESDPVESQLLVMDAIVEINGCAVTTFNFADAGKIEVRNDLEFIYVKIIANGNYDLIQSNLHITAEVSGFPTTGKGGINVNKMEYQNSFKIPIKEYTYKFPLNSFGNSFLVGAYSVFQLDKKKYSFWAGDLAGSDFSYFDYNLFKHPNAGADKSREISYSEAKALPSWDETRKAFTSMLDPGVPEGQFVGSFEPTISEIITKFNSEEGGVGSYTTIYTIGKGECTDSVVLTLIVVPDDSI